MARAGLFDDLDACLDWHPADTTEADVQSSLALVDFKVEFFWSKQLMHQLILGMEEVLPMR